MRSATDGSLPLIPAKAGTQSRRDGVRPRIAFGIDLSGYVTGKSVCAAAVESDHGAEVSILQRCPFSRQRQATDDLASVVTEEVDFLEKLLASGPVAVDIPIDLQGLPSPVGATEIWQLTLRPIDRLLRAMPPLADRIGAPTARFRNIVRAGGFEPKLGRRLFETYPRGSLKCLGLDGRGYKGPGDAARSARRALIEQLGIRPTDTTGEITDDELDATICAITALAGPDDRLEGIDLTTYLNGALAGQAAAPCIPPCGFVLLKRNPFSPITVARTLADEWRHGRLK